MLRKLMMGGMLLGAVGVPYAAFNDSVGEAVGDVTSLFSSTETKSGTQPNSGAIQADLNLPESSQLTIREFKTTKNTPLLYTPPVEDFRDVFRFDVSPNWVKSHWPRVSANVYENGMQGLRVPLVTGTEATDIQGSLTYFFDDSHQVQRISFDGCTGDVSILSNLVVTYHGFQQVATQSAGLYLKTYNGRNVGALKVTNPAVIRANDPNRQLRVMLEINSTVGIYRLSERFDKVLGFDKNVGRW